MLVRTERIAITSRRTRALAFIISWSVASSGVLPKLSISFATRASSIVLVV